MEFKLFMQKVEQEIEGIRTESELRDWIKNYARSIPEENRENFLEQFCKRECKSHEDELQEFYDFCEKIEDWELTLSCSGYEEYGESYWDRDWVYEYSDPCGIGEKITHFYTLAERCIYDRDYTTANRIYGELCGLEVAADDEDSGDAIELSVEELIGEGIINLDPKRAASLSLYAAYQAAQPEDRAAKLYTYFSQGMFEKIKIEDMLSAGVEPLQQTEEFMDSWIAYLRNQQDSYTARLLTEAILYHRGTDGLLEEAKRCANNHPKLAIEILEQYYAEGSWEKLHREGREVLSLMNRDMEIRGKVGRLTAAGAREVKDEDGVKQACFEALYSEPSPGNYLRLLISSGLTNEDKEKALARIEEVLHATKKKSADYTERYNGWRSSDKDSYALRENEYLTIHFLADHFDMVLEKCKSQKEALGWSGNYIRLGVPLLLVLLYRGEKYGVAMKAIISEIDFEISYKCAYNEPSFWETIIHWKKQAKIDEVMEKDILKYLQEIIDNRVAAIVSGGHRGSYYKAAKLGAALGEVEESLGVLRGKACRTDKYLNQFPRHRAFKAEMKEFL